MSDLKDLAYQLDNLVFPYRIYTEKEECEIKNKIKEITKYYKNYKNLRLDENIILAIRMTIHLFYGHFDL
jgi:hypothetical protein